MKDQMNNLPLSKKAFLFSFYISFILVVTTAGLILILQAKEMEKQMRSRVTEMSLLWNNTLDAKDISELNNRRDYSHPLFHQITEKLSIVNKNARHTNAYLLSPEFTDENDIFILAGSGGTEETDMHPLAYYAAESAYINSYKDAILTKAATATGLYKDHFGLFVSSFVPITGQTGEVVGVINFKMDAALINKYQKNILIYVIGMSLLLMSIGYFILNKGLRKVLSPVNDIIFGFNEVSNGNFNVKLKSADQYDVGVIAERFNNMTSQLSLLFERLSATSEEFGTNNKNIATMHRFEEAIDEMEQILHKTKIQRELQKAEKMNAIGQLAASVAHEIRNPMTVVKGFLQIFLAKEQMSEEERTYIKLMIEEMNRAETIINDYLSLAKPDMEQVEEVDAAEAATKVLDLMNSYAMMSKNINVMPTLTEGVFIKGNLSELKQVLINILKNGIEAMKEGGTLTVAVYRDEKYGIFEISDTGIGMSSEELERLGTAFYSLKEKGTGIGMMVCYQIIERMKGKIEVQSQNGQGTTFKIYVPIMD
ncbi:two-component sensor histidine kinase [Cytobacillus depressus]|uniref:histidine kinase n=1 Tax=Cytobacillus depressus TaxID=1602942 RepID=A0A6L3V989_9BACI|nr:HAMP domain-containing sensor histidine kinase [Cytobacillus depressus]KAB2338180.1 two-component sensor histidine kinase [Cytobacillus depressus]